MPKGDWKLKKEACATCETNGAVKAAKLTRDIAGAGRARQVVTPGSITATTWPPLESARLERDRVLRSHTPACGPKLQFCVLDRRCFRLDYRRFSIDG